MITYKIVEKTDDGYKFLFHNRKCPIRLGDRLIPDKKMVYESYDRNRKKRLYLSGIHVIESKELCQKYLKKFKRQDNKVILLCDPYGCVVKPKGNPGVLLADEVVPLFEV